MRTFIIAMAFAASACGGKAAPKTELVPFDPEMAEACVPDEALTAAGPACDPATDASGRRAWTFPLAEGDELKRVRGVAKDDPTEPALYDLYGAIIVRAERMNCGGDGCERYERNVRCEAEVARAERAAFMVRQGRWREAFYDAAAILRAGPDHFGYETVSDIMRALEPHIGGAVHACMANEREPESAWEDPGDPDSGW